jgi:hypothetical protein|tara:strand:- start:488 stop:2143 length:1656 start_codon:yes stop_codon:yes gene_type:complete
MDNKLKDFRNFLFICWKHLNLPDPTPVQYDIATFLQNKPKRGVIEAFRGVGKSYITSAFVCHTLLLDPELKVLVVSASKVRSDDFSTFTQRLIHEIPILQHLRSREGQRQSKVAFDVGPALASHSPSVKSVGITGQLAGSRADLIVADDVEVPNNSMTQSMRDKLSESVKEFDAILKPEGSIIYLGTPQTEMSLYETLPERGYSVRIWPSRFPTNEQKVRYGDKLAPLIAESNKIGEPTDPLRFDDEDLTERELSYGRSGFNLQFQLDTSLSDADKYPLKLNDLIVMSLDGEKAPEKPVWSKDPEHKLTDLPNVGLPGDGYYSPQTKIGEWLEYTGSVLSVDPSGRGRDETGYAVVKMLNGILYVTECGGLQGGYKQDNLQTLSVIARRNNVNLILIESNFGDGMFMELWKPILRKVYDVTMEEVRSNIQKEKRIIDTLEPVMNQHRLVIDPQVIEKDIQTVQNYPSESQAKYMLFHQMTRITKDKGALIHDDRLDALQMAVGYWVEQMATDAEMEVEVRKDRLKDEELERFVQGVMSNEYKETSNVWMNI